MPVIPYIHKSGSVAWLNVGFCPESDLIAAGSQKRRDMPQAAVTFSCSDIA
jgi:hypothetical protein